MIVHGIITHGIYLPNQVGIVVEASHTDKYTVFLEFETFIQSFGQALLVGDQIDLSSLEGVWVDLSSEDEGATFTVSQVHTRFILVDEYISSLVFTTKPSDDAVELEESAA
jgi:hypothetical protein